MATLTAAQLTTLRTAFEARYSLALRINWTNTDTVEATGQNDTRLDVAFQDVADDFEIIGGMAIDTNETTHVKVATQACKVLLRQGAADAGQQEEDNYAEQEKKIKALSKIHSRNRVPPDGGDTATDLNTSFPTRKFRGIRPR